MLTEVQREYLERVKRILDKRRKECDKQIEELRNIEPVKGAIWSGDKDHDLELTILVQSLIGKLVDRVKDDSHLGYVSMGKKLLTIEDFLHRFSMSFPSNSPVYSDDCYLRLSQYLESVASVLGMPNETVDQAWLYIVP